MTDGLFGRWFGSIIRGDGGGEWAEWVGVEKRGGSKAARQQLGQVDRVVLGARLVCGASLPTTTVSYSVPVNVLKIEYFFLIRKPTRDRSRTKY